MRALFTGLLLLLLSPLSQAMEWGVLEKEINSVEAGNPADMSIVYQLTEIITTVVVYSRMQHEVHPEQMLFCPQQGTSLNFNQVVSMIRKTAADRNSPPTTSVQELLLLAYRREYPC